MSTLEITSSGLPTSRETEAVRLKLTGLVCTAVSAALFGIVSNAMAAKGWFSSAAPSRIVFWCTLWVVSAHLWAIGLIVLLGGLQNVRLLTSGQARKGAWTKLAGASLLIVCFAFLGLSDSTPLGRTIKESWTGIPVLALFVITARAGTGLLRKGWKYEAIPATQLLAEDPRPPIVYLRPFQLDDQIAIRSPSIWRHVNKVYDYTVSMSPEQEFASILSRVGPVVAIGKPGERLPELGAARLYAGDNEWKSTIADLIRQARLVVIRAGETPNLWWEIEQAMTLVPRTRVLLLSFGPGHQNQSFDRRFEQTFGLPVPAPNIARLSAFGAFVASLATGRIIYFGADLHPHVEPIAYRFSWLGFMIGGFRPYRDSIRAAMRKILPAVGLPWQDAKSQSAAVLLALFFGMFGLHCFYLGELRKGFWRLGLWWTGLPLVLGLFDAVRYTKLTTMEFEHRYARTIE